MHHHSAIRSHSLYFASLSGELSIIPRFIPDLTTLYRGDAIPSVGEIEVDKVNYLKRNQIVSVEFDSFSNPEWVLPFKHVGINKNSIASSVSIPRNASLHSGNTADALIVYNSSTKNLSVSWSYGSSGPNSTLSHQIDLKEILPQWVVIGFSAATRMTVVGGFMIAGGMIGVLYLRKRRLSARGNRETANLTSSTNEDLEKGTGQKRFCYKELGSATSHFSNERKLGEGGFGEVYRGHLVAVAVKKISRSSKQGKKQYITEVKTISSLRNRNLLLLIRWCHDKGEFLLVYEIMPNDGLDSHLFGKKTPLSWALRYKIALGLASALLYLHEEWR
ncbi:hypothetical protein ACH5RR_011619 [Cinchona calisaya]|uniref:non-specific serine/threonine protein kinase n=1 Tax=Cinchona calisaya TaxID=153742 RepID=A0ABD3A5Z2_9GENT